jgi:16S rRNA processing protein RimM
MDVHACFQLGYLIKKHGVGGEMQAMLETETPSYYKNLESVFVEINQKLVPFFIQSLRISERKAVFKFEDIDSAEDTEALAGARLFLPLTQLPPMGEGQFYYHDVVGYDVEDIQTGPVGKVTNFYLLGEQDILAIDCQGKEVLIPIVDAFIHKVDKENQRLIMNLPDGLIDIYLEEA